MAVPILFQYVSQQSSNPCSEQEKWIHFVVFNSNAFLAFILLLCTIIGYPNTKENVQQYKLIKPCIWFLLLVKCFVPY